MPIRLMRMKSAKEGLSISRRRRSRRGAAGVDLEATPIYVQVADTRRLSFTALLAALVQQQGKSTSPNYAARLVLTVSGHLAGHGHLPRRWFGGVYDAMAQLTGWAATRSADPNHHRAGPPLP